MTRSVEPPGENRYGNNDFKSQELPVSDPISG